MNGLTELPPTNTRPFSVTSLFGHFLSRKGTIRRLEADIASLVERDRANRLALTKRDRSLQCISYILMCAADGVRVIPKYISPTLPVYVLMAETKETISFTGDALCSLVFHVYLPTEAVQSVAMATAELRPGKRITLRRITVLTEFQNRGIGSQLLSTIVETASGLSLSWLPFEIRLKRNFTIEQAHALFSKYFDIEQHGATIATCRFPLPVTEEDINTS